jgi:hypothetical protein
VSTTAATEVAEATISLSVRPDRSNEAPSVTDTSISVLIRADAPPLYSSAPAGSQVTQFAVQYRSTTAAEEGSVRTGGLGDWNTVPNSFFLRTRGMISVVIQEISVFSDVGDLCSGLFFLELWDELSPLGNSLSPGIPFAATVTEMENALSSMERLRRSNAVVSVQRQTNVLGGYTWTVKIIGAGSIPTLQYRSDTFSYQYFPPFNSTGDGTYPEPVSMPCWTRSRDAPVDVHTISSGSSRSSTDETTVTLSSLRPLTSYDIRAVAFPIPGNDDDEAVRGNSITVLTKPSSDILESFINAAASSSLDLTSSNGSLSSTTLGSWDARGRQAARQQDEDYVPGVAMGGNNGEDGGDGYCILVLFSANREQPYEVLRYPYARGLKQAYHVPSSAAGKDAVSSVTAKCWGGGGGGGQASGQQQTANTGPGGGGAYSQLSMVVLPGDVITIQVCSIYPFAVS